MPFQTHIPVSLTIWKLLLSELFYKCRNRFSEVKEVQRYQQEIANSQQRTLKGMTPALVLQEAFWLMLKWAGFVFCSKWYKKEQAEIPFKTFECNNIGKVTKK